VAKELQKKASGKTALIEQDYLRRIVLKEKDVLGGINAKLILQTVQFSLDNGYNVILEGIFVMKHYRGMLNEILEGHSGDKYLYYFDIPFSETLLRHATKHNSEEFGETEMRQWYKENDITGNSSEVKITQSLCVEEIVNKIVLETKL